MKTIGRFVITVASIAFLASGFFAAPAFADHRLGHKHPSLESPAQDNKETAKDPVCGMDVAKSGAKNIYEYKGTKYYFCSKDELEKFKADPKKYLKK
jgi:YHS domain-containing protein